MENVTGVCFLPNTQAGANQDETNAWLLGIMPLDTGCVEWVLEVKSDLEGT